MLKPGQKAPNFSLPAYDGSEISLKDLNKKVVLYFYPKDNTSGCTIEAKEFTDLLSSFEAKNTIVLGVSRDSVKSHCNFRDKQDLKIMLLSDKDEVVCKAYDVIREKSMYGRKYMGIVRTTFLINEEGIIDKIWGNVKASGHAQEVLGSI